ncbi:MAG: hypothetical protein ACRENY_06445 [Candidatus Dormibacteria bacterium]
MREEGLAEEQPGEVRIRPTEAHRRRVAMGAAFGVGVVLIPVGLVLGLLSRSVGVGLLCVLATAVAGATSYMGQGHNEVFVGPRGLRRVARNCDMIATWGALRGVQVKVPGNRIVAFSVTTSGGLVVESRNRHQSHSVRALIRHPPEGFELRLDRQAADAVVAAIAERRPEVGGLADWERASRPT